MKEHFEKTPTQEDLKKLANFVEGIGTAMLTNLDEFGNMRSRPMVTQEIDRDGAQLWFFASDDAMKTTQLESTPRVNVAYSEPKDNRYVSISGSAKISHDPDKIRELWNPSLKAWFPKGLKDPHLCLIQVQIEDAEYWETPLRPTAHS